MFFNCTNAITNSNWNMEILQKEISSLGKKSSKCPNQIIFLVVTPIRSVAWVIHKRAAFSFKDLITLASSFNIDIYTCSHVQSPLMCVYWPSDKWVEWAFTQRSLFLIQAGNYLVTEKCFPWEWPFPQYHPSPTTINLEKLLFWALS